MGEVNKKPTDRELMMVRVALCKSLTVDLLAVANRLASTIAGLPADGASGPAGQLEESADVITEDAWKIARDLDRYVVPT